MQEGYKLKKNTNFVFLSELSLGNKRLTKDRQKYNELLLELQLI